MSAAAIPLSAARKMGQKMGRKMGLFLDAIKFHESIFALPFAYTGMILAAWTESEAVRWYPTLHQFIWITVAMVGARTVGMAANRIIDRHIDAQNPRNASRHLPSGKLRHARHDAAYTCCIRRVDIRGISAQYTCTRPCAGRRSLPHLLPVHEALHMGIEPAARLGARNSALRRMDRRSRQPSLAVGPCFRLLSPSGQAASTSFTTLRTMTSRSRQGCTPLPAASVSLARSGGRASWMAWRL